MTYNVLNWGVKPYSLTHSLTPLILYHLTQSACCQNVTVCRNNTKKVSTRVIAQQNACGCGTSAASSRNDGVITAKRRRAWHCIACNYRRTKANRCRWSAGGDVEDQRPRRSADHHQRCVRDPLGLPAWWPPQSAWVASQRRRRGIEITDIVLHVRQSRSGQGIRAGGRTDGQTGYSRSEME